MKDEVREDVLKRLNYIEGHLAGVRRMIEEGKSSTVASAMGTRTH
jgi:DNA-binding FrmR family transcriptional regulator